MPYVVTVGCVDVMDRSCMQECPVDCIYEGGRMAYVNPTECIDCGACGEVCPHDAIKSEHDLKPDELLFRDINAEFFEEIGDPGGATDVDVRDRDVPRVRDLAPRREDG
ncbi:4Fe-4S binding protein [Rhodococcus rhodochrous]|uniref:ferredoxin n=1 Tax=Rhodococcus rhodochrous TaxID=1829 RepID=UPI001E37821E|nr:ferredoxin [Rhodococcus rhodochrous]MCB8913434.1 4Fe-4S binding protein [Rhodococcus rhodochrous]